MRQHQLSLGIPIILLMTASGLETAQCAPDRAALIQAAQKAQGENFREVLPGVDVRFKSKDKEVALTLDLCDGAGSKGLDQRFVNFLVNSKIKATLFVSGRWARRNKEALAKLGSNPLFQIENHGFAHKPVSSKPRRIYGISSTRSLSEVYDEVMRNDSLIQSITKIKPKLFRSGTAYYDNKSISLIQSLGYRIIGYNVLPGDAAHPFNLGAMVQKLKGATPGSIILMHLNHPDWKSGEAFAKALPWFESSGFEFVHLNTDFLQGLAPN